MKKLLGIIVLGLLLSGCVANDVGRIIDSSSNHITVRYNEWVGAASDPVTQKIAINHCAQYEKYAFYFLEWSGNTATYRCYKNYVAQLWVRGKHEPVRWTSYNISQQTKSHMTSTISSKKKKCIQMGFKEDTEKLAECVLRLVEIDEAKQNNQIQKQRNSEAAIAAMLGTVVQSTTSNNNQKKTCFKTGEETGGFNKVCRYSCVGNLVTTTIGSMQLCPLTIQR